jgi:hypothetical protein
MVSEGRREEERGEIGGRRSSLLVRDTWVHALVHTINQSLHFVLRIQEGFPMYDEVLMA